MKDNCQNSSQKKDKTKREIRFPYVAVDFDGTLCEDAFPEIGKPREKCIEYVKQLAEEGSKIILYTCRENGTRKLLDEAVAFCGEWEIPIFAVNENPENEYPAQYGLTYDQGRKLYADLYLDDKAVNANEIASSVIELNAPEADNSELPEGGTEADKHWMEVMKLAEKYGFIVNAFGGTAVLITNKNQLDSYGLKEYVRIQRMNGRCAKEIGLNGCIDSMTSKVFCSTQCELY